MVDRRLDHSRGKWHVSSLHPDGSEGPSTICETEEAAQAFMDKIVAEECVSASRYYDAPPAPPRTRWERLLEDDGLDDA